MMMIRDKMITTVEERDLREMITEKTSEEEITTKCTIDNNDNKRLRDLSFN